MRARQKFWASRREQALGLRVEAAELVTRSTPHFEDALAQLILAASRIQRAGGTVDIALRRNVAMAPRILFTVRMDDREFEFVSLVDADGFARAVRTETRTGERIPLVRSWDLGSCESPAASAAHRLALVEFLSELRPGLGEDQWNPVMSANTSSTTLDDASRGGPDDTLPGHDAMRTRLSWQASLAAFGVIPIF